MLFEIDDVLKIIENRLKSNWILLSGVNNSIQKIEYSIYTPGTKKNADFESAIIPTADNKLSFFYIAKKNEELRTFLKMDQDDFSMLLTIEMIQLPNGLYLANAQFIQKEFDRNEKIDIFMKAFKSMITEIEV